MPRYRRPRRQGVVYGPVTQRERGPDGGFIGRVLGLFIVLAAVAVLGVGALNFVGGGEASPRPQSPSPVAAASASPLPSPAPTLRASPTASPLAPASPSPTSEPSPAATPFELEVLEGPGYITFGTRSTSNLRIADPRVTFALDERMTLSAQLTEPAGSAEMTILISRLDPDTGQEEEVAEQAVRPNVSSASVFLRNLRPNRALDGTGIYVMRYVRGDAVLSEGWFEVTEP